MTDLLPSDTTLDLACETLYRYLAAALRDPLLPGSEILADPDSQRIACAAADLLRDEFAEASIPLGFGQLPAEELSLTQAVAALAKSERERQNDFVCAFGLATCRECPPYETEYHKAEEVFFRSQQMADVAGFYQAFGLAPGGKSRERPDHLTLELEFMAFLLTKQRLALEEGDTPAARERAKVCHQARADFFRDHLSWWAPSFALALRRKMESGFYAEIARTLAALLPIERQRLGVSSPIMPLEANLSESPDECSGCLVALG